MGLLTKRAVKSIVDKATTDDQSPTPGFLYNEINKLSFGSVEQCQILLDVLLQRLTVDSADVRLKALRVIKQLLMKGHRSFHSELQRRTTELQACLDYRGPPDPMRGDMPYQRMRDEAKEIMKLIFVHDHGVRDSPNTSFGSSDGIETSFSSTLSNRITGTGNYVPPEEKKGMLNIIKESSIKIVNKVRGDSEDEFDPHKHWNSNFELSNFGTPPSQEDFDTSSYSIGERTTKPGLPGGMWADVQPNSIPQKEEEFIDDTSDDDEITPERTLVDKTTLPGGMRSVLSKMEVGQFIRNCNGLKMSLISKLLYSKLKHDIVWQTKLRSLCLIEGILMKKVPDFVEKPEYIVPLIDASQTSIKERAQKILQLMDYTPPEPEPIKEEPVSIMFEDPQPKITNLFSGLQIASSVNPTPQNNSNSTTYSSFENPFIDDTKEIEESDSLDNTFNETEESTLSQFDFINDDSENSFNFIEKAIAERSTSAELAAKEHQQKILQKYKE